MQVATAVQDPPVSPQQHGRRLFRGHFVSSSNMMQVYAPGFRSVLTIPAEEIRHLPPPSLNVTRLVLCANYDPRNPEGSCPMGARCKFVHADATAAPQHEIHVNYAWRSLEDCTYERFTAGEVLHVAPPNSKTTGDVMDSQLALKTKALESTRRPLSHCAHYYFNRTCNLGPECRFIHAVFVDPNAKEHQRAPAPAQLGREHHHQQYRQQRAAKHRKLQPPSEGPSVGQINPPSDISGRLPTLAPSKLQVQDIVEAGMNAGWTPGKEGTIRYASTPGESPWANPSALAVSHNQSPSSGEDEYPIPDEETRKAEAAELSPEACKTAALSRSPVAQAMSMRKAPPPMDL